MQRALELAAAGAALGEAPIGAVVVAGDRELAAAHNTRETEHDPCGHAEVNALRQAAHLRGAWRLDDCEIFVSLEPCAMCAGAMVLSRVRRCVYAASDPKAGFCGSLGNLAQFPGLNHHFSVESGVLQQEASEMLRGFFRRLRTKDR